MRSSPPDPPISAAGVSSGAQSGVTALILGFFACAWFGWGQADASRTFVAVLTMGSGIASIVAALGAIRLIRSPRGDRGMKDPTVRRRYGIVVGSEFIVAGAGAAILGATGAAAYIPAWICAVVGVHFFALALVLDAPALHWLGAVVTAVAAAAALVGMLTAVAPGSVTGPGAGLALVLYAILVLARGSAAPAPI
jgi:hypothetical protein